MPVETIRRVRPGATERSRTIPSLGDDRVQSSVGAQRRSGPADIDIRTISAFLSPIDAMTMRFDSPLHIRPIRKNTFHRGTKTSCPLGPFLVAYQSGPWPFCKNTARARNRPQHIDGQGTLATSRRSVVGWQAHQVAVVAAPESFPLDPSEIAVAKRAVRRSK